MVIIKNGFAAYSELLQFSKFLGYTFQKKGFF
jgi:hypothetical protein